MSKKLERGRKLPTLYHGWVVIVADEHTIPFHYEDDAKKHAAMMNRTYGYARRHIRIVPVSVREIVKTKKGKG